MINDLKNYVDNTEFPNHKISVSPEQIIINTLPNNINLIIDYIFSVIVFFVSFRLWRSDIRTLTILIPCALISTWIDFNTVCYINIDLVNAQLKIYSKNPVKRIFTGTQKIPLSSIKSFYQNERSGYRYYTRYRLYIQLKNQDSFLTTDFKEEAQANTIVSYLNRLLS